MRIQYFDGHEEEGTLMHMIVVTSIYCMHINNPDNYSRSTRSSGLSYSMLGKIGIGIIQKVDHVAMLDIDYVYYILFEALILPMPCAKICNHTRTCA